MRNKTIAGVVAIEGMADGASLPVTMTEDHLSSRYQESRSYNGSAINPAAEFEVPDGFLLLIQRAACSAQQDRAIRRARLIGPDSEFTGANGETHRTVDVPLAVDASGFSASAVTDFLTPGRQFGFPPDSNDPRYVMIAVDVVEGVGQASGVCTIIGRLLAKLVGKGRHPRVTQVPAVTAGLLMRLVRGPDSHRLEACFA